MLGLTAFKHLPGQHNQKDHGRARAMRSDSYISVPSNGIDNGIAGERRIYTSLAGDPLQSEAFRLPRPGAVTMGAYNPQTGEVMFAPGDDWAIHNDMVKAALRATGKPVSQFEVDNWVRMSFRNDMSWHVFFNVSFAASGTSAGRYVGFDTEKAHGNIVSAMQKLRDLGFPPNLNVVIYPDYRQSGSPVSMLLAKHLSGQHDQSTHGRHGAIASGGTESFVDVLSLKGKLSRIYAELGNNPLKSSLFYPNEETRANLRISHDVIMAYNPTTDRVLYGLDRDWEGHGHMIRAYQNKKGQTTDAFEVDHWVRGVFHSDFDLGNWGVMFQKSYAAAGKEGSVDLEVASMNIAKTMDRLRRDHFPSTLKINVWNWGGDETEFNLGKSLAVKAGGMGSLQQSLNLNLERLTKWVLSGKVTPREFEQQFREQLQKHYEWGWRYAATSLGEENPSQDAYEIEQLINHQVGFLKNYVQALRDGTVSEAQAMRRSRMYAGSLSGVYEKAKLSRDLNGQYRWDYSPSVADHCGDCSHRNGQIKSAREWMRIGLPREGKTQCNGGCQCKLVKVSVPTPGQTGQYRGWIKRRTR